MLKLRNCTIKWMAFCNKHLIAESQWSKSGRYSSLLLSDEKSTDEICVNKNHSWIFFTEKTSSSIVEKLPLKFFIEKSLLNFSKANQLLFVRISFIICNIQWKDCANKLSQNNCNVIWMWMVTFVASNQDNFIQFNS